VYRYYKVWRSSAYAESYLDEGGKEREKSGGREREIDRFSRERESRLETKQRKRAGWHGYRKKQWLVSNETTTPLCREFIFLRSFSAIKKRSSLI
jgi:hypothetical protein